MDRVTLEDGLRRANARVAAGQQALLEQRAQVRELEQWSLDASLAKALLRLYEESHANSILERRRLHHTLATAMPPEALPVQDNNPDFVPDYAIHHREAA